MWIEVKYYGGSLENLILGEGSWDCLKRGIGQFVDLKVGLAKKRGWCF